MTACLPALLQSGRNRRLSNCDDLHPLPVRERSHERWLLPRGVRAVSDVWPGRLASQPSGRWQAGLHSTVITVAWLDENPVSRRW